MNYKGVPNVLLDGLLALTDGKKRDAYFVAPRSLTKGDMDAWIFAAKERKHAGCLPPYRIAILTVLGDENEDGVEYLLCWYERDPEDSSVGRFRTHDDWLVVRDEMTRWVAGLTRDVGARGYRMPGEVMRCPMWYPPYP